MKEANKIAYDQNLGHPIYQKNPDIKNIQKNRENNKKIVLLPPKKHA